LLLFIEKCLARRIDHIFVIDKRAISFLKHAKDFKKRVSFSSSGVDFSSWAEIDKKQARLSLGLDPDKKYLFYLGKYYQYKAVDRLCEIYKKVKQSNPNIQLIVAGGSKSDIYYENIRECGAIDFKFVPNNELPRYFSAADVYVCVSHLPDWFGGIGVAMLESLACRTPVVSNSLNQIVDTSLANQIGRAPITDEEMIADILYVLDHQDEYKNCREAIRKYYDYEQIQRRTREVYEQLLELQRTRK
jgi:glycosyltransferase involved in cell wall biosynthesis